MDIHVIGPDHVPVSLLSGMWSVGWMVLAAAPISWWMIHAVYGEGPLRFKPALTVSVILGACFGAVQHVRGSDLAGSIVLGLECAVLELVACRLYLRFRRWLKEHS